VKHPSRMVGSNRYSQEMRLFYMAIVCENGRAAKMMWKIDRLTGRLKNPLQTVEPAMYIAEA
jgi:hypothetical protein